MSDYCLTPNEHSLGGYIGIGLSVCPSVRLSGPTSTSFVRFPPNFVEFTIMMCELLQYKGFYCPLSLTPAISRQKHVTFIEIIMFTLYRTNTQRGIFMVINATFNNISVIAWLSVLLVEYPEKNTDLPQVTDKLYHINLFILQSVHLLYKYAIRINFCFIRTRRINFSAYE